MYRRTKVCSAVLVALGGGLAGHAMAQTAPAERIEVTGSRILRTDLQSSSPIVTVPATDLVKQQDITLETTLNNLPQVNPAGTTTSNNPGNGGQANIDLRGLGSNRNLVLIDGRRPMVSASDQTVDVNTIPFALIESVDVITGGAGAVYGADAVAGVVNIRLKKNFEGLDLRAGYRNTTSKRDSAEKSFSFVTGGNFEKSRGNAVMGFEYSSREGLIKNQRDFAKVATATTSFFPEGTYRPSSTNQPSQAALDALYGQATYGGAAAGTVPRSGTHSFNTDGSLIYTGIFNSPRDVINWRYPVDSGVNTNLFPDVYSYNFDAVNILVLPLERRSVMGKFNFDLTPNVEVFSQFSNTRYTSTSALAPTPVPTVNVKAPDIAKSTEASSTLVAAGKSVSQQLIVPVTNPFIPADLKTLLDSRTGDDPNIVGSGATEPFLMRWRTLGAGLREANYENNVTQYLGGLRGSIAGTSWGWEAYFSEGRTKITNKQTGNIDTNRLLGALAAADGGASLCTGGVNPFGRQALSADCAAYLSVDNTITNTYDQQVAQAFVTGEVAKLPAGAMQAVFGAEARNFKYTLDPGSASGPISGFNVQDPAGGKNKFRDLFTELQFPLLSKQPWAQSLDLSIAARTSQSQAFDTVKGLEAEKQRSNTYAFNLTWQPTAELRARGSLQKAVRAPNFGELFDGGGSNPQYFDPCSVTSKARTTGANAAQLRTLCRDAGEAGGLGSAVDTYVQTPGTQASISVGGNLGLKPETGNSVTLGLVWVPTDGPLKGFSGSIDFYQIKVKDAITTPDTNEVVADCYNYYGRNPTYDPNNPSCAGIFRAGDILGVDNVDDPDGVFAGTNGGRIKTSGLDFGLGWSGNVAQGRLSVNANLNYLLKYELRSAAYLPTKDLTGTIPYFGAGLGQAFPKLKAIVSADYKFGDFGVSSRIRYIDKMSNRMEQMFPGESFTGVAATTYVDFGASWEVLKGLTLSAGLVNAFDQKPRTYAPNVQSGTDPSTYDVVGRRYLLSLGYQLK